jgi:hypothetical protein
VSIWRGFPSSVPTDLLAQIQRRQRISSMVFSLSSKQEIATPMACLYLLWSSPFSKSHGFAMLFIGHLLDTLKNTKAIDASFVQSENGNLAIYSSTTDWVCCRDLLEQLSLYEFTTTYKKVSSIDQLLFNP